MAISLNLIQLTIKITGVFLSLELWNELCLLTEQFMPVEALKELVIFNSSCPPSTGGPQSVLGVESH